MEYHIYTPFKKNGIDYTLVYCSSKQEMTDFVNYDSKRTLLEEIYGDNLIFISLEGYLECAWAKAKIIPIEPEEILLLNFDTVNIG